MLKTILINLAAAVLIATPVHDGVAAEADSMQTSNERGLKVTVILKDSRNAARDLEFEVMLETHTRALNDVLAKSSLLVADGKQYLPASWEGAAPGGHHRKGVLHFKAIQPPPQILELRLHLAGEPSPRSFKWPSR